METVFILLANLEVNVDDDLLGFGLVSIAPKNRSRCCGQKTSLLNPTYQKYRLIYLDLFSSPPPPHLLAIGGELDPAVLVGAEDLVALKSFQSFGGRETSTVSRGDAKQDNLRMEGKRAQVG